MKVNTVELVKYVRGVGGRFIINGKKVTIQNLTKIGVAAAFKMMKKEGFIYVGFYADADYDSEENSTELHTHETYYIENRSCYASSLKEAIKETISDKKAKLAKVEKALQEEIKALEAELLNELLK